MKKKLMKIFPWIMMAVMLFALVGCEAETVTVTTNKTITNTVNSTVTVNNTETATATATNTSTVTSTHTTTITETETVTPTAAAVTLNIFAGAGMIDVISELNALYMEENSNVTIVANFAAGGTLQTQIENGAPCDVFINVGAQQMNNLETKGLLLDGTRLNLPFTNSLVLIVPVGSILDITDFTDLTDEDVTVIAIGDPSFVPAGKFAESLFTLLGITEQLEAKLLLSSTVREVLTYVETGNADAGFVYLTDALTSDSVTIVATAPDEINSQIIYTAAVIKASENVEASNDYLAFLASDDALAIFESYGFSAITG
jgi:molybdate transport system substrate-binding protein